MNKILLVIGLVLFSGIAAYKGTRTYMPHRWEYHRADEYLKVVLDSSNSKGYKVIYTADSLGNEGWELVAIVGGYFYFKRPLS